MNNSNLMWVRYFYLDDEHYILKKREDFKSYSFVEIPYCEMTPVLSKELESYGLIGERVDGIFYITRNNQKQNKIAITAPLYEQEMYNCKDRIKLIANEYTGETPSIQEYELTKNIFFSCIDKVRFFQEKRFVNIFRSKSLDNGKTATFEIISTNSLFYDYNQKDLDDTIYDIYIPSEYIALFEDKGKNTSSRTVVFIKKIDAHGKPVKIKVPEKYVGAIIGKKGCNIQKIAEQINASFIKVEKY